MSATASRGSTEPDPALSVAAGTFSALADGNDAVLLARLESSGALCVDVVNDAARALFALTGEAANRPLDDSCPDEVRPLLRRIREGATRTRATREQVALGEPDGARVVVDLQLDPLPRTRRSARRVLAVVRFAEADGEPSSRRASVGVFRTELGLGAVFLDDDVLSLLGLAQEQALGQGWLDAISNADRSRVAALFEGTSAPLEAIDVECTLVRGERSARIRAVPVRGDSGAITGYLGSIEDITDERRNAQAVARLAELADVLDEWILVADPQMMLRYANPAARAGLALPGIEALGSVPLPGLVPEDRRDAVFEQMRDALAVERTWTGDLKLSALDGRAIELECTVVAHRTADGAIAHYSLLGRDVTTFRTMERALDESQQRLALLVDVTEEQSEERDLAMLGRAVESTPDIVTLHDPEGRMFFANAAARGFFALKADDPVPARGPSDFLDASPHQLLDIEHALAAYDQWTGELTARNDRGDTIPVEVVVVAHRDPHGDVEYYSSVSRDLSERRTAEDARRRSETVLRAIVQASPLAIFAFDRRGVVHVWNRAAEELFGWLAAEVVGSPPPFVTEQTQAEFEDLATRVFGGRTVKGYLTRFVRHDGTDIDVDVSIAPVRNSKNQVVTGVAVLADMSEQKRATEALLASEVWFRSLVQHSTDMVMVVATDGTVSYVSPSAAEFAGVERAEVLHRPATDVFSFAAEDALTMHETFERLRAFPGSVERIVFRSTRGDGDQRWIEMMACNLLEDPAVQGVVVNARDVTETFEAERAVRASEQRLQALLSSVSDAIVVLDAEGSVSYSSPVADTMFSNAVEENDDVFAPLDPDDLTRAREIWERTRITPGVSPPAEVRINRAGGAVDAEVIANNLLDDPAVEGIVMTIRDVTARKASEEALRESEARLRESEARYRAVVDDQIELVCRYGPVTEITFVNRAFADFYGRARDDLIGTMMLDLHPPARQEELDARIAKFSPANQVQTYDEWELGNDGSRRCYRWIDRAFFDGQGELVEVQSVGHDVTDERRASVLTTNQAEILELVARGVPLEETLTAIARTVEQHFSKVSCAVFLLEDDGVTLRLAASPTLPREGVIDGSVSPAWTMPILGADGRTPLGNVAAYSRDPSAPDADQQALFSLLADLASIAIERKAFEERLTHESMHDPLTGLPNRLLFMDRLQLSLARGRRTGSCGAVLFLDLDRFKNINDSAGHDVGDELLVAVARRLESVLRPGDTVARFGGDEFTILCDDVSEESASGRAVEIADRLVGALSTPFDVRDTETYVGATIGIAIASSGAETAEELLRDADAAMYHAKDAGRGRVAVFDDTMRARALERHATENALHRAIERDELRLFFQPIVRLSDARCVGAEALVRWQHPERGLVPPAEFIPLAEDTGLIAPLGAWVLEHAAAQAARWQLDQEAFSISINLSGRQLADPELVEYVAGVIRRSGVTPANLCLEITETVLMEDADAVIRVIENVRELGVKFAIDDFGTGYSSLGYLKRFAVDAVKIDRAFIDGLGSDAGDQAIVSAVIGLAHTLGLSVVAEGVETEVQLTELLALGCDEAQGYFFAPPQPAQDLRGLVSATRRWRPPGSPLMRGR
jgi:diguanylate cyclase (GGDEF)-like protein/PAS domain S-box-containing protein